MEVFLFNILWVSLFWKKFGFTHNYYDLIIFTLYISFIALALTVIASFLAKKINKNYVNYIFLPLVLTAFGFDCFLIFDERFMSLGIAAKVMFLLAAFLLFCLLMAVSKYKKSLFGLLLIVFSIITFTQVESLVESLNKPQKIHSPSEAGLAGKQQNAFIFKKTPNIYIIGFLAAQPGAVLSKTIGLEHSPLEEAMENNKFRIFRNTFSEAFPTRNSYEAIFSLTQENYNKIQKKYRGQSFSGNIESPFVKIFRTNGYEITTINDDYKFGLPGGRYVDHYLVNRELSICKNKILPPDIRDSIFFGGCFIRRADFFRPQHSSTVSELLLQVVKDKHASLKPQLVIAHLKPPIHAPSSDLFKNDLNAINLFRNNYNKAAKRAADNLSNIKMAILDKDPASIIIVVGDSGVHITSKLGYQVNDKLAVQDNLAVLAGIYPANTCSTYFDSASGKGYMTTVEVIRELFKCLSDGHDAFPEGYMHQGNYHEKVIDFKEYLYE